MDIYEKNRALNLKMEMKKFFLECIDNMGTSPDALYNNGEIYNLNMNENLFFNWIYNNVSTDFCVFYSTEDGETKDFIHVNITKDSELVAYLHSEVEETDEYGETYTNTYSTLLNSKKISEYDARMFLNAIYINGELKGLKNFCIDDFDFTIQPENYEDHISFWNGSSDIEEEFLDEEYELGFNESNDEL